MLAPLLAAILPCLPTGAATAAAAPLVRAQRVAADDKPLKALDAWLKLYRQGKIDYRSKTNIAKDSIALKFGLSPRNGIGDPTWAGDLAVVCEAVAKLDTAEAAQAILEVAAIGIDQGKYTVEMAPHEVRLVGETWAAKFTSTAAKDEFAKAARGELKVEKARLVATQAAGARCLGLLQDRAYRAALEIALADSDEIVRVSAAESLGALGDEATAPALIAAVERETVDAVLIAAVQSLRSLYAPYLPKPAVLASSEPGKGDAAPPTAAATPPESLRLAVRAAILALGRTTWRADMAIVRLLDDFRSQETIPALVGVLERFHAHPEEIKSGKLSGLLLYQAHELLVGMTGAVFPADQPEKWRAFWEAEKDKISVTQKREPKAATTVVDRSFCGIPVQGTRVVFVLDLSGSMAWPMDEDAGDGKKTRTVRLDFAKRELCRAVDLLNPAAHFNLVSFNGDDKAEPWSKELVPASERNRERFKKYVMDLRPLGGTNLWSGLEDALKIKSLVYGNRYTSNVDELFVLSDGAPTVGAVQDPIEILRLVQECNKFANVRINTVFISSATPAEARTAEPRMAITPQELMRRLAEQNRGQFREL
jgi:hypothetical protein